MAGRGTGDKRTRAQHIKAERQESLRELLSSQGHLQHIVELHSKLIDAENKMDALMVQRVRIVIDSKHKLLDKYLPTEKPSDITADVNVNGGLVLNMSGPVE